MSSTGVRESNSNDKRIIKGLILNEGQFIQSLRVFANSSTLSGLGSTEGEINNSPKDPSGNYLSRLGDTMLGPLALTPPLDFRIVIDANNTIDIGPLNDNAQYTSNVQLDSIQPNSFVLDIIANAAFDGQLLFLRTFAPTVPFTISQGTLGNGGNIQTGDGNDLTVGDLQIVTLIFDEALVINANTGGTWRVLSISSSAGGGGISFPIDFPEDDRGTVGASTQDILFTDSDRHSVKMIVSGDVNLAFSSPPTNETAYTNIIIVQDGTGGHIVTVPPGTINKAIVDAGILTGLNEETGIVIKFAFGVFYAFLETGNIVTGGSAFSGNLSDLVIDVNKDWLAQGISNVGALTGVTGIDLDGATALIQGVKELRFFDDDPNKNIQSAVDELSFNVPMEDQFSFYANAVEMVRIQEVTPGVYRLVMLSHSIRDAKDITFDVGATNSVPGSSPGMGYDVIPSRLVINVPSGSHLAISENAVVGSTEISNNAIETNLLTANSSLLIGVLGGAPVISGQFTNDGTDTFVFSGGAVRNFSNISTTLSANVNLSNLVSPTSINQNLIPQAGLTLGDSGNPWSNLTSNKISLGTAGSFAASDNAIIADALTGMELNTPSGDLYSFHFGLTKRIEFNTSELKFVSGGQFEGAGFILTDAGFPPVVTGELRRDGDTVIWEAPIFQIQRTITGSLFTQFNLVKVDAAPSSGEPIADINFQLFDSPTTITYAQISAQMENVTNSGELSLNVRADSALTAAMRIIGRSGSIRYDIDFRNETILKASSGNMGYFVTADPGNLDNIGNFGTIQIPQFNDGSPSLTDLNQAFGAFDGAIGQDINDGRLYVRKNSTTWSFYSESGTIT